MSPTSTEPHDHHHTMPHAADVANTGHGQRGTTGHAGHGEPGAHDRHAGHTGILLPPAFAAVLMSASTVIVAINAQLLRRAKL